MIFMYLDVMYSRDYIYVKGTRLSFEIITNSNPPDRVAQLEEYWSIIFQSLHVQFQL